MKNEMIIRAKRNVKAEKQDKAKDFVMSIIDDVIFWTCYGLMILGSVDLTSWIFDKLNVSAYVVNNDILWFAVFVMLLMISFVVTRVALIKIHRIIIKHVKID